MKQITTILLASLVFLQPFSKIWIVVDFRLNQDYIAQNLCVKKEIKDNDCRGRCQLCERLDKATKEEQKQAPTSVKDKAEVLYYHDLSAFDFLIQAIFYQKQNLSNYHSDFYASSSISDIFRPPQLNLI